MTRFPSAWFFLLLVYDHVLLGSALILSLNNFLLTGPKAYLKYARSVQAGAHSGIEECKHQFAWDRWNCPEMVLQASAKKTVLTATKEMSFVHAISAAGVMYTLTKNCSRGDLDNCGCDDSKRGVSGGRGWVWGGCSDNVAFGEKISRMYVDALETGQDSRAVVNLHNNEAGRQAVKETMKKICRCHGMSDSCTVKTCWLQLSSFRDVGNYLKVKHDQARKLEMDKRRNSAVNRGTIRDAFRAIGRTELIYLEDSPDYCVKNSSLGLQGTEGRECLLGGWNLSQWERRSCQRLCHECRLKVEEIRSEKVHSCKCKFHWCCTVQCDMCTEVLVKHVCTRSNAVHEQRMLRSH